MSFFSFLSFYLRADDFKNQFISPPVRPAICLFQYHYLITTNHNHNPSLPFFKRHMPRTAVPARTFRSTFAHVGTKTHMQHSPLFPIFDLCKRLQWQFASLSEQWALSTLRNSLETIHGTPFGFRHPSTVDIPLSSCKSVFPTFSRRFGVRFQRRQEIDTTAITQCNWHISSSKKMKSHNNLSPFKHKPSIV